MNYLTDGPAKSKHLFLFAHGAGAPMTLVALSQEHGKIETSAPVPVGTRLRIIPNHSCLTAAMYDEYHVVEGSTFVDIWQPVRGW